MRVLSMAHPSFLEHRSRAFHPERPERLAAVDLGLRDAPVEVIKVVPRKAELEVVNLVHTSGYISAIEQFCLAGGGELDPDTYAVPETWEAALFSAGSGPEAAELLLAGQAEAAFCGVRPPGHHAIDNQAMGFCIFNNVAVTARYLTEKGHSVAIVDWDVHHGNGTQDLFIADKSVLYVSLHQFPFYPGGGWLDEIGYGPGAGATINIPLPSHTAGDVYREAFRRVVTPVIRQFGADWLLVSAGYDAHRDDPLAELMLVESDYAFMGNALNGTVPEGRTIFFLEGGYNLDAIRGSVAATLAGFAGEFDPQALPHGDSDRAAWRALELVEKATQEHWLVR